MKNLPALICLLFLKLSPALAQVSEHSLAFGFDNKPSALQRLTNGNYVAVGRGTPIPGGTYGDTIFAIIFTPQGDILYRKRLSLPPAEEHRIVDLVATPDGGFAISVSLDLCDASFGEYVIQRYDSMAALVWSREPDAGDKLCYQIDLSPDGNLIGIENDFFVIKLDIDDGSILWKYPLNLVGVDFLYIRDIKVFPGTENLMATGLPNFQYWSKSEVSPGVVEYALSGSQNLPFFTIAAKIIGEASGVYYTFADSTLCRFNQSNFYEQLNKLPYAIKDAMVSGQEICLLCRQGDNHRLVKTNLAGQITSDVALPIDAWMSGSFLGVHNGTFVIAGINGSGPTDGAAAWTEYNATNLWFRTFTDPAALPSHSDNAAVTGVVQAEPLSVIQKNLPWSQEIRYTIEGGNFSVQVSNHGQSVLDEVDVLVGFSWNDTWICWERPVHRKHYKGLALAPDASVLLDFGNVLADFQPNVPSQLCFWTSAPNERPDGDHDDDTYCHTLLVGSAEPELPGQLRIFPNPVADVLHVEFSDHPESENWQLFTATGQFVASGSLPAEKRVLDLETGVFVNGIYIFKAGKYIEKVVVQH